MTSWGACVTGPTKSLSTPVYCCVTVQHRTWYKWMLPFALPTDPPMVHQDALKAKSTSRPSRKL